MDCNETCTPGTVARLKCAPEHTPSDTASHTELQCQRNGEWNFEPLKCVPICGSLSPDVQNVPWHAVIYTKYFLDMFIQNCGGSIISPQLVISAAHCFWHENGYFNHESLFQVGIGKYYRKYNATEVNQVYLINIIKLVYPVSYQDSAGNHDQDIVVLILAESIRFQEHIRPICMDRTLFEEFALIETGWQGFIPDWEPPQKIGDSSTLKMVAYETISRRDCAARVSYEITNDKFCVGDTIKKIVPCQDDGGSGFVRQKSVRGKALYHLLGVVSFVRVSFDDVRLDGMCNKREMARVTNVLNYEYLINKAESQLQLMLLPDFWKK